MFKRRSDLEHNLLAFSNFVYEAQCVILKVTVFKIIKKLFGPNNSQQDSI